MSNIFKKAAGIIVLVVILTAGLKVQAAEFASEQDLNVTSPVENLYASGTNVKVNTDIKKDLIVAGQFVEVQGTVERSLMAAGQTVKVNARNIGASVRAAGQEVTLEGTFNEDVVVAGATVVIRNANIRGDLIVASQKLVLENSKIAGDAQVSYSQVTGDVDAQVAGELSINVVEDKSGDINNAANQSAQSFKDLSDFYNNQFLISSILGSTLALLAITIWLNRRKRLEISSVRFNGQFFLNWIIGLGIPILTTVILITSLVINFFPFLGALSVSGLVLNISLALLVIYQFGIIIAPIYLANLMRNSFKLEMNIMPLTWITFAILVLLNILGNYNYAFGFINGLIWFFLGFASFTFVLRKLYSSLSMYLKERA
ncbi:MAG: hypothetical protein OHK0017_08780 [Patescibacteria group bacterium]